MRELNLKLTEIFKPSSLKPYITRARCAIPADGSLCYIWNDGEEALKDRLNEGKKFKHGGGSTNNLIELKDSVYDTCKETTIIVGPNTTTKTQTIRFISSDKETTRIIFNGWGSSTVVLWEGLTSDLMRYLTDRQPIQEGVVMIMLDSFLETGLWSTSDYNDSSDNPKNLDDEYNIGDISESFKKEASEMIAQFMVKALPLLTEDEVERGYIAHDLWLTLEGHGAGFWDGDYEQGDELTKLCKEFGGSWGDKLNEAVS